MSPTPLRVLSAICVLLLFCAACTASNDQGVSATSPVQSESTSVSDGTDEPVSTDALFLVREDSTDEYPEYFLLEVGDEPSDENRLELGRIADFRVASSWGFSENGEYLAGVASAWGELHDVAVAIDVDSRETIELFEAADLDERLRLSWVGNRLLLTSSLRSTGLSDFWVVDPGRPAELIDLGSGAWATRSGDSRHLAIPSADGAVVFDLSSGERRFEIDLSSQLDEDMVHFSPRGEHVALVGNDSVLFYETESGNEIANVRLEGAYFTGWNGAGTAAVVSSEMAHSMLVTTDGTSIDLGSDLALFVRPGSSSDVLLYESNSNELSYYSFDSGTTQLLGDAGSLERILTPSSHRVMGPFIHMKNRGQELDFLISRIEPDRLVPIHAGPPGSWVFDTAEIGGTLYIMARQSDGPIEIHRVTEAGLTEVLSVAGLSGKFDFDFGRNKLFATIFDDQDNGKQFLVEGDSVVDLGGGASLRSINFRVILDGTVYYNRVSMDRGSDIVQIGLNGAGEQRYLRGYSLTSTNLERP